MSSLWVCVCVLVCACLLCMCMLSVCGNDVYRERRSRTWIAIRVSPWHCPLYAIQMSISVRTAENDTRPGERSRTNTNIGRTIKTHLPRKDTEKEARFTPGAILCRLSASHREFALKCKNKQTRGRGRESIASNLKITV